MRNPYSQEQLQFLRTMYLTHSLKALTTLFNEKYYLNLTLAQMKGLLSRNSIKSGRTGCFAKGHVPDNKGMKGRPIHPNSAKHLFKKGNVPPNLRELGAERICPKDGYILVKVQEQNPYTKDPTRFKLKHQVVWEQHNGPLPPGHKIRFLDGDKLNCDIDNLALISNALNLHLNQHGYNNVPDELKTAMLTLSKLEVAYFAKVKELTHG